MKKIKKITAAAALFGVLGVVALPIAGYAAPSTVTDDVTVEVIITDGLTIGDGTAGNGCATTNYSHNYGTAGVKADSTGAASELVHGCVTVFTNWVGGYTLTLADKDADTNLKSGANNIPTQSGNPIAGTPGWAVAVSTTPGVAGSGTLGSWLAMPASGSTPITLHDAAGVAGITGDNYDYAFATAISPSTVAGTYVDTVTFTAAAK